MHTFYEKVGADMIENELIPRDTIDYDDIADYSDEGGLSDVLTDAVSEATVAQVGIQTISLQTAMDN